METSESNTCALQVAGCGAGLVWSRSISPMTDPWMDRFLALERYTNLVTAHEWSTREGCRLLATTAGRADGVVDQAAAPGHLSPVSQFLSNVCTPLVLVDSLIPPSILLAFGRYLQIVDGPMPPVKSNKPSGRDMRLWWCRNRDDSRIRYYSKDVKFDQIYMIR
jgi:hypothetical protein